MINYSSYLAAQSLHAELMCYLDDIRKDNPEPEIEIVESARPRRTLRIPLPRLYSLEITLRRNITELSSQLTAQSPEPQQR